ncbi:MAG: rhomboid family intramembrane serine protease [Ferruginibacter sp.]|nr:rhomboid family intramembrane serine protease [Bacteroidota bacterium]MBX2918204.1 rhomboid family intramembrane serine protease [Ferruginibacter sp.]MBX2934747.1 rhomboid family intramembrane serine protease [Ferruginibacter sp.]MCB0708572.1 rhomboid family intramembrane serine protease [Chitinophagaceae bacterium]MCC7378319.1 rhomboid family intramembrane serine protease [Chitinophagaceae bacterium]
MAFNNYGNRFQRTTPIVLNLIIINALVYLVQYLFDGPEEKITRILALFPYETTYFKPYQLVTHMFAHGGFFHLFFNMFVLWMFGSLLERAWGPKRFLIFYFICGIAAGITHLALENVPAVGASGAIMGLFAAFAYLFPNTELIIFPIPVPVKAKYAIALMAAYDLFGGVYPSSGGNIAHFAHLGGLVMGLILVIIWNKTDKKTFY